MWFLKIVRRLKILLQPACLIAPLFGMSSFLKGLSNTKDTLRPVVCPQVDLIYSINLKTMSEMFPSTKRVNGCFISAVFFNAQTKLIIKWAKFYFDKRACVVTTRRMVTKSLDRSFKPFRIFGIATLQPYLAVIKA